MYLVAQKWGGLGGSGEGGERRTTVHEVSFFFDSCNNFCSDVASLKHPWPESLASALMTELEVFC